VAAHVPVRVTRVANEQVGTTVRSVPPENGSDLRVELLLVAGRARMIDQVADRVPIVDRGIRIRRDRDGANVVGVAPA